MHRWCLLNKLIKGIPRPGQRFEMLICAAMMSEGRPFARLCFLLAAVIQTAVLAKSRRRFMHCPFLGWSGAGATVSDAACPLCDLS